MSALDDLFRGLAFYGTGGGGRAETGLAIIRDHLGKDFEPVFTSPYALPDETLACATIVVGGRDPDDDVSPEDRAALGLPAHDVPLPDRFAAAIAALGRLVGRPVGALAVVELGSVAMAASLVAGAKLGIPVLDCDGTGRSIPELGLAKFDLAGMSPAPLALVDRFGGETLLDHVASAAMADRMARHANRAVWGRGLACASYPAALGGFRRGLVAGSLTRAGKAGAILGEGGSATIRLDRLLTLTGGRVVAEAIVDRVEWIDREPYAFRHFFYHLDGAGAQTESRFQIYVKNEHHAVWREEEMVASGPDAIVLLDRDTLEPLTTLGEAGPGRPVLIMALPPIDPAWNTEAGLALLGPTRFGLIP